MRFFVTGVFTRDSRYLALVALLLLGGCMSYAPAPSPYAARAAAVAQKMVGTPYRYGGESPAGFDCSGLAYYAYQRAGLTIPRKSTAQRSAAKGIGGRWKKRDCLSIPAGS